MKQKPFHKIFRKFDAKNDLFLTFYSADPLGRYLVEV